MEPLTPSAPTDPKRVDPSSDLVMAVLDALLWTLDYGLGKAFDEKAYEAWSQVMLLIANTMILGRYSVDEAKRRRYEQTGSQQGGRS